MIINKNKVVKLMYILHEDNEKGALIEQTTDESPLEFIYGIGQMLPEFEKNIENLKVDDTFAFQLSSDNAYGAHEADLIVELDKNIFTNVEGVSAEEILQVGNVIPMRDNTGALLQGVVKSVSDTKVEMDFNHPMAGKNLHFSGKVVSIREATEEELNHGHIHQGGCSCC